MDEAVDDLDFAKRFYDEQENGIGRYFVASLLSDITSLQLYAGIHPIHFGFHRMFSKRFPFAVYYEIVPHATRVVGVLDMRQNPKSIRRALKERRSQPGVDPNA